MGGWGVRGCAVGGYCGRSASSLKYAKAGIVLTEIKEKNYVPTDTCAAPWGLTVLTKQPKLYI